MIRHGVISLATICLPTLLVAEVYESCYSEPDYDRWMYAFNASPGTRTAGPTFGGLYSSLDDRYGQSLFGWVTIDIPTDLPPSAYRVTGMTVNVSMLNGDDLTFDNTEDPRDSHGPDGVDPDPGRPFYLSGAGFRAGFNAETFGETGPHPFGAGVGGRNVYPLAFDESGVSSDISNNLSEGVDVKHFAVGDSASFTPGSVMTEIAEISFEVDVSDQYIECYLREALAFGTLDVVLTSFHAGAQDGSGSYPQWILKDNILVDLPPPNNANPATMCIEVEVTLPSGVEGDVNSDGAVNVEDLLIMLAEFGFCPCCRSDFDGNREVDIDEVLTLIANWTG